MADLTDAIAAAHAALDDRFYPGPTEDMVRAAIEAAAPIIAAKALREAADAQDADPEFRDPLRLKSDWLRARADAIEAGQP